LTGTKIDGKIIANSVKVFFVQKDIEHYFFGNKKELIVLYFFGGPDS